MKHKLKYIIMIFAVLTGLYVLKAPSKQELYNNDKLNSGEKETMKKVERTDEKWKEILSPEQYNVMRNHGTERSFSGKYNNHYEQGIYVCAGCGTPLFSSDKKYDHGTGWPSFTAAVDEKHIAYINDYSHFMKRIEVRCAVCGAHLGHFFDDGPLPTRKHYCINSVAMEFEAARPLPKLESNSKESLFNENEKTQQTENAIFAAGCFWGVEHTFRQIPGVLSTKVGYTGGQVKNPTYRQICTDATGHAEAVKITFDPSKISYAELLNIFFRIHNPTQLNRQGPDIGTQYRSEIFYLSEEQKDTARKLIEQLQKSGFFKKPIVTRIVPATKFYEAEEYHQKYIEKRTKANSDGCGVNSCGK